MNRQLNQMSGGQKPGFTPKQGQYLAFIDAYTRVHRRPPAEWEMQRHFGAQRFAFMPLVQACFAIKLIQIKVRFTAMAHTAFR